MVIAVQEYYTDDSFSGRLAGRRTVVSVIGLGYVGLPLILGFHDLGFPVTGFDIDPKKISALMNGQSYIGHINDSKIGQMNEDGGFHATTDFSELSDADVIIICVPTPLAKNNEPDLSHIRSTANAIAPHLRKGQLVVLESTTYPGTTREVLTPMLEAGSGLKSDEDFFVAFSPEREDPGNTVYSTTKIPKVVGADSAVSLDMAGALYETLVPEVVRVSSMDTAEAVKLTENIFRAVNIALVNELKIVYGAMGVDIWEVIDAAKTKPFGFMPFYPGPGLGGHCIPIDPFYLTWKARQFGMDTRFIELAGEINCNMPAIVVQSLIDALKQKRQKDIAGARILVVGAAYKKNVEDVRESPSLVLMDSLQQRGATVEFYDPHVRELPMTREHPHFAGKQSVDWSAKIIQEFDAVLIATDHDIIRWGELAENASLIIDTRNSMKGYMSVHSDKIVKC